MTNLSGGSNPPNLTLPVHTLRKDRERKENKCILATCAIGRRINVADSFVGTGSLVKDFYKDCDKKIHLITSRKVISSKDISGYSLCFKKSKKGDKRRRELSSIGNGAKFISHGLTVVAVDPDKFSFIRRRTSGLLTYRPFAICGEENEGNSKLYCHFFKGNEESFTKSSYPVIENVSLDQESLGAPTAITGKDGEAKAFGIITCDNNMQISHVLFSQINRSRVCSGW